MDLKKLMRVMRQSITPSHFIKKVARWFFDFEWIYGSTCVTATKDDGRVRIGIDFANLYNMLWQYSPPAIAEMPFYGKIDSDGDLNVNGGSVYAPNQSATITGLTGQSVAVDKDVCVKYTITENAAGAPYSITTTLQVLTGGSYDNWSETAGVITKHILIGTIRSEVWVQKHTGDVNIETPGWKQSIEIDTKELHLVGDAASPGNNKAYGTSTAGVKGWIEGGLSKVSSNDTTPGYLNGKLTAGNLIDLTEGSDGGNETLAIAVDLTEATGYEAAKSQVLYNNASTIEWEEIDETAVTVVVDCDYNTTTHILRQDKRTLNIEIVGGKLKLVQSSTPTWTTVDTAEAC